jgi:hypothetical protein
MEIENYYGAHGDNIVKYQKYESQLANIENIKKVENVAFLEYIIEDSENSLTNTPLKFYFQIREDLGYFLLTDNGDNFSNHKFDDEDMSAISTYLDGSSVGINFENTLNLVYLEIGELTEDINISFVTKKYIDALTYINDIIE